MSPECGVGPSLPLFLPNYPRQSFLVDLCLQTSLLFFAYWPSWQRQKIYIATLKILSYFWSYLSCSIYWFARWHKDCLNFSDRVYLSEKLREMQFYSTLKWNFLYNGQTKSGTRELTSAAIGRTTRHIQFETKASYLTFLWCGHLSNFSTTAEPSFASFSLWILIPDYWNRLKFHNFIAERKERQDLRTFF